MTEEKKIITATECSVCVCVCLSFNHKKTQGNDGKYTITNTHTHTQNIQKHHINTISCVGGGTQLFLLVFPFFPAATLFFRLNTKGNTKCVWTSLKFEYTRGLYCRKAMYFFLVGASFFFFSKYRKQRF